MIYIKVFILGYLHMCVGLGVFKNYEEYLTSLKSDPTGTISKLNKINVATGLKIDYKKIVIHQESEQTILLHLGFDKMPGHTIRADLTRLLCSECSSNYIGERAFSSLCRSRPGKIFELLTTLFSGFSIYEVEKLKNSIGDNFDKISQAIDNTDHAVMDIANENIVIVQGLKSLRTETHKSTELLKETVLINRQIINDMLQDVNITKKQIMLLRNITVHEYCNALSISAMLLHEVVKVEIAEIKLMLDHFSRGKFPHWFFDPKAVTKLIIQGCPLCKEEIVLRSITTPGGIFFQEGNLIVIFTIPMGNMYPIFNFILMPRTDKEQVFGGDLGQYIVDPRKQSLDLYQYAPDIFCKETSYLDICPVTPGIKTKCASSLMEGEIKYCPVKSLGQYKAEQCQVIHLNLRELYLFGSCSVTYNESLTKEFSHSSLILTPETGKTYLINNKNYTTLEEATEEVVYVPGYNLSVPRSFRSIGMLAELGPFNNITTVATDDPTLNNTWYDSVTRNIYKSETDVSHLHKFQSYDTWYWIFIVWLIAITIGLCEAYWLLIMQYPTQIRKIK